MGSFLASASLTKSLVCYQITTVLHVPQLTSLVDAQMVQDAERFTMDLFGGLERVLHGKIKPSKIFL